MGTMNASSPSFTLNLIGVATRVRETKEKERNDSEASVRQGVRKKGSK